MVAIRWGLVVGAVALFVLGQSGGVLPVVAGVFAGIMVVLAVFLEVGGDE